MTFFIRKALAAALGAMALTLVFAAQAQPAAYPSKPIRIID
jgi:tripartite-type tricarboxylate transporter receptor subunit TctC